MYDIPYESTHTQLWFRSKQKYFKIQNSNFAYLWTNEPQNGYSGALARITNELFGHEKQDWKGFSISQAVQEIKFVFSKKATKIDEIFTVDLTLTHNVKSMVKISSFLWPS